MNATPDDQFNRDATILTRIKGWRLILMWTIWITVASMLAFTLIEVIPQFIRDWLNGGILTNKIIERGISPAIFFPLDFSMNVFHLVIWYFLALLIVSRRRNDWLAIVTSIMILVMGYFLTSFNEVLVTGHVPSHLRFLNDEIIQFLDIASFASIIIFFGTFPTGKFVPRWIMPVLAALFVYFTAEDVIIMVDPKIDDYSGFSLLLRTVVFVALIIFAQLYRHRQMEAAQRQQTKLAVIGAVMSAIGNVVTKLVVFQYGQTVYLIARPLTFALYVCAAVCFTYAILRHHLWDIDFAINRSLVYGGLTVLLGTVFIGGFFALRTIMETMFGNQQDLIAIAVPAVVITALFTPTRNRLQRYVDQHFYGIEIDYKKAVEEQALIQKQIPKSVEAKTSFGQYTGLELIGRGGMGEVYRAKHPILNYDVAIKVLPKYLAENEAIFQRYDHEARAVAQLKHPNIVGMYEYGTLDGMPYIVLEYIEGQTLSEELNQRRCLSLTEALPLFTEIASALDYSHAAGVIHRDIKPSNVMIEGGADSKSPRAVLMDFGIAKLTSSMTQLTSTGVMIGTFDYVSPEQIQSSSEVDAQTDIYSFGAMAYQTLTGALPFEHKNISALLMAHLMQPAPDPRELAPDLPETAAKAIMKAMTKNPQARQKTAGEFVSQMTESETT